MDFNSIVIKSSSSGGGGGGGKYLTSTTEYQLAVVVNYQSSVISHGIRMLCVPLAWVPNLAVK